MHPPFPLKQCWSVPQTIGVIAHKKFSVTACTSPKNQHCLGGGGGRMLRPDHKYIKCPRTFGEYCTLSVHLMAMSFYLGAHPAAQILSLRWTMSSWIKIYKQGAGCSKNVMAYILKKIVGEGRLFRTGQYVCM